MAVDIKRVAQDIEMGLARGIGFPTWKEVLDALKQALAEEPQAQGEGAQSPILHILADIQRPPDGADMDDLERISAELSGYLHQGYTLHSVIITSHNNLVLYDWVLVLP